MAVRRADMDPRDDELREWIDSIESVLDYRRPGAGQGACSGRCATTSPMRNVIVEDATLNTPYRNTIPLEQQPRLSRQHRDSSSASRTSTAGTPWPWCCVAMTAAPASAVTSAPTPRVPPCSRWACSTSSATRGPITAATWSASRRTARRASMRGLCSEGRLSVEQTRRNFRRELAPGGGLSSYPHPRNMPDFWASPCASMGLSTPSCIYQARFRQVPGEPRPETAKWRQGLELHR
jgi:pyruvate dehydrogenase E1 component